MTNRLGFITPFNTFGEDEGPTDPLAKEVMRWMADSSVKSIPWVFSGIPSEQWKAEFGADLLSYINGSADWPSVAEHARSAWTAEAEIAGR